MALKKPVFRERTPVGLGEALPTKGALARSLRSHVASSPTRHWLRQYLRCLGDFAHTHKMYEIRSTPLGGGTNFIRFVYTTPNFTPFSEYGASLRPELIWKMEFLISGGVRFQILYIIFLLVGMKRGMVFISDFKKWIMYTFMAHPSGWDIKYT